jgi:hypothetical protein
LRERTEEDVGVVDADVAVESEGREERADAIDGRPVGNEDLDSGVWEGPIQGFDPCAACALGRENRGS